MKKIILSFILIFSFFFIVITIKPSSNLARDEHYIVTQHSLTLIEDYIYAIRINIFYNKILYQDIRNDLITRNSCEQLCFYSFYYALNATKNHITKDSFHQDLNFLQDMVKNNPNYQTKLKDLL